MNCCCLQGKKENKKINIHFQFNILQLKHPQHNILFRVSVCAGYRWAEYSVSKQMVSPLCNMLLRVSAGRTVTQYARQCPNGQHPNSWHLLILLSSTSVSSSIPVAVTSHTITVFLDLSKHCGAFFLFVFLYFSSISHPSIFSFILLHLLQTRIMLGTYRSQTNTLWNIFLWAYAFSTPKRVLRMHLFPKTESINHVPVSSSMFFTG